MQFLSVSGPATAANAIPYLASLVQLKCDLIIAAGQAQTAAVAQSADRFTKTRFIVLATDPHHPNVTALNTAAADLPRTVAKLISDAAA